MNNITKSPWEKVLKAREKSRMTSVEYINSIFNGFIELHGDRFYGDDKALIGGIACLDKTPVTVIGTQKGRDLMENIKRNFGMVHPEGYRKANRLMRQAEKFNRPIICFIDTPGAYCGVEAEERGQGEAIARNLMEMSKLKVPLISIIIGEGGSGGALALAVSDRVWMLENSIYSVLSPEGFASILWKDGSKAKEAAEVMKITAEDLMEFKIIEKIIDEPENWNDGYQKKIMTNNIKKMLKETLKEMSSLENYKIIEKRYERVRKIGEYKFKKGQSGNE
jgi:acetyl-CoA carboxylase carboxyl transferase alpha subunit